MEKKNHSTKSSNVGTNLKIQHEYGKVKAVYEFVHLTSFTKQCLSLLNNETNQETKHFVIRIAIIMVQYYEITQKV